MWKVEDGIWKVTFSGHKDQLVFDSPSVRAHEIVTYRDAPREWKERLQVRAGTSPDELFVELRTNCEPGEFDGLWELTTLGCLHRT